MTNPRLIQILSELKSLLRSVNKNENDKTFRNYYRTTQIVQKCPLDYV